MLLSLLLLTILTQPIKRKIIKIFSSFEFGMNNALHGINAIKTLTMSILLSTLCLIFMVTPDLKR